jgi:dihydrofolate synthase/folylpolyglutamate synthase
MVEASWRAAGAKTGLYTSPHLVKLSERIRIAGVPIADDVLEETLERALAIGPDLSFFETITLAAFLAFRDACVDVAVLEVGIGGRLDATNVVPPPRVAAITGIAFDHMDKLGNTLVEIAREKAGIAKNGTTLVVGDVSADVRQAIIEVAEAHGASVLPAANISPALAKPIPALAGAHQLRNRDVAVAVCRLSGLGEDTIARGVTSAAWPGRLESVERPDGAYLLDGAHNPDGARALAIYLHRPQPGPLALVFGALADKAWPEMLDVLAAVTPHRVYVEPKGRAATPPADLAQRHAGSTASDLPHALAEARALVGPDGLVVVCGSLYLVGEARALLLGLASDPPVAM